MMLRLISSVFFRRENLFSQLRHPIAAIVVVVVFVVVNTFANETADKTRYFGDKARLCCLGTDHSRLTIIIVLVMLPVTDEAADDRNFRNKTRLCRLSNNPSWLNWNWPFWWI